MEQTRVSVRQRPFQKRFGQPKRTGPYSRAAMIAAARAPLRAIAAPGEFKSVDVNGQINSDLTGGVGLLNGIAPGSGLDQRIGRQVTLKSIQIRFQVNVTSGTGVDQVSRVLVVYDRQSNAAAPTTANIISAAGTGYDVLRPKNLDNRKRFKILMDRTFYLNASGESNSGVCFNFYRRLRHPMEFNAGVAGTIADIVSGSIYVVCVGNQAVGATAGQMTYFSRVRYVDV